MFSAEAVQRGVSLLKDRVGEIIGSELITIVDDPFKAKSPRSGSFDSEGVATQYKEMVKDGKLTGYLHNLKTAKKANTKSTGNASGSGVGPTNFYIEPGDMKYDDAVKSMKKGLIITDLAGTHSGANAISGAFSLQASGYLVEDGKVVRPVALITVAGNYLDLLKDVVGKKEQNLVDTLTIRSMSKAEYTTKNIGHYGLAFDYYSHFTSPIRRYPDVIVHRLLEQYLNKEKPSGHEIYNYACDHCTQREILATKAERDSIKFMQIKYMQDKKNKKFNGVISGITDWGIFVEIVENKCEGMIPVRDLKGDYYIYNKDEHSLIGKKTKIKYQLGDSIQVQVKHADLIKKQLDFILAE